MWSQVARDLDTRVTALARSSSNCTSKITTTFSSPRGRPILKEQAEMSEDNFCGEKEKLVAGA
jgi:hypothetical protein